MSKISKYAFKDIEDAKEFQKMYGGKIMNFNEAREVAKKDFKNYR
jgi:nitrous oxide reductase accessory protein NosL